MDHQNKNNIFILDSNEGKAVAKYCFLEISVNIIGQSAKNK